MAGSTELPNEEKAKVQEIMGVGGILTELLTTKSAKPLSEAYDIKYYHVDEGRKEDEGQYLAYKDILKPNGKPLGLTDDDIKKISITRNGETPRYFERIHKVDQTAKDAEIKGQNTGFKALAWIEMEEVKTDGEKNHWKPKLNDKGEAQVTLTFPGYDGNPLEGASFLESPTVLTGSAKEYSIDGKKISPQTASMFAVGDAKLYPPTQNVPAFISEVQQELNKREFAQVDMNICGHSMGCATSLTAAIMQNTPMVLNEPVAATLAVRQLREAYAGTSTNKDAQALVEELEKAGIDQQEFKKRLANIEKNSISIRTYTVDGNGNVQLTKSATMQTCNENNQVAQDSMRCQNIQHMVPGQRKFNEVDSDNETFGKVYYVNVTASEKVYAYSKAAMADPNHVLPNVVKASAENDNLPIYTSLEAAKQAAKAAHEEQQKSVTEPTITVTQNLKDNAVGRRNVITSIHEIAKTIDDGNFTYSDTERQNFKTKLGDEYETKKTQWHEAHAKGAEAIANAQDKSQALRENRGAGDLNGDGKVTESEAQTVASWMQGATDSQREAFKAAVVSAAGNKTYVYEKTSQIQVPQTQQSSDTKSAERK